MRSVERGVHDGPGMQFALRRFTPQSQIQNPKSLQPERLACCRAQAFAGRPRALHATPRWRVPRLEALWVNSRRSPFAENDGVIADHIAAPQECIPISAAVRSPTISWRPCRMTSRSCCPAMSARISASVAPSRWARVLLEPMVHLDDFQVEAGTENLSGFARQPEQRVHPGGIVGRPDDGDLRFAVCDLRFDRLGMTGGSDHQRFSALGTELRPRRESHRGN